MVGHDPIRSVCKENDSPDMPRERLIDLRERQFAIGGFLIFGMLFLVSWWA